MQGREGILQFCTFRDPFSLHKEDTEHTVIHNEGRKINKHLTRCKIRTLEQRQFFLKAFECQIFLGFSLPCHHRTAFLFHCLIFNHCREHNFKLNVRSTPWWVLPASFLLPLLSHQVLLPSHPSSTSDLLTNLPLPTLLPSPVWGLCLLQSLHLKCSSLFNCHPQISRDTPGAHICPIFC